jgi:hypothetical protein
MRLVVIERLYLGFLVHTQHHRPLRRIEVETNDIGDFLLEQRVVRHLEPARQMRLQARLRLFAGTWIRRIDVRPASRSNA